MVRGFAFLSLGTQNLHCNKLVVAIGVCDICRGDAACVCTNVCTDVADAFVGRRTRRVRLEHASLVQRDGASLRFARRRVASSAAGWIRPVALQQPR